jgi:acetyl-CoA carboxylase biotin carboxyl carrier protein
MAETTERGTSVKIDLDQIRSLLAVVSETDITELTIESGEEKITVKKGGAQVVSHQGSNGMEVSTSSTVPLAVKQPVAAATQAATQTAAATSTATAAEPSSNGNLVPITSPMVGTFYRAPSPTAPAYVEVGDNINVGQTICIIEAMKLMNDLPSEISGKVVKILVENGSTVEFGQQLMLVDPKG